MNTQTIISDKSYKQIKNKKTVRQNTIRKACNTITILQYIFKNALSIVVMLIFRSK